MRPKEKIVTRKQIERTIKFLEENALFSVVSRSGKFLRKKCGGCPGRPEVDFELITVRRGSDGDFTAYECPQCHLLADAGIIDAALKEDTNGIDFIY